MEAELLHTFTKIYKFDTMLLLVRLAVLTAVTLTVPIVLFPVSTSYTNIQLVCCLLINMFFLSQFPAGTKTVYVHCVILYLNVCSIIEASFYLTSEPTNMFFRYSETHCPLVIQNTWRLPSTLRQPATCKTISIH